jgi:hypothetical protein
MTQKPFHRRLGLRLPTSFVFGVEIKKAINPMPIRIRRRIALVLHPNPFTHPPLNLASLHFDHLLKLNGKLNGTVPFNKLFVGLTHPTHTQFLQHSD